jgi:uncharacterized phiE125 gp8 family phage protein
MLLIRTVAAAVLPVTLAELRLDRRIADDDVTDDALLAALLRSATEMAEQWLGRALIDQTWRLTLDRFGSAIDLPKPPLIAVTEIVYTDTTGAAQVLDPAIYRVIGAAGWGPGRVVEAWGETWPATRTEPEAVRVTYRAGYGGSWNDVPEGIRLAILRLAGTLYEHREDFVVGTQRSAALPTASRALMAPWRIWPL